MPAKTSKPALPPCTIPVLVLFACSGAADSAPVPTAVRTDSAGVEIVVHGVAADAVPVFATLDDTPNLRLGAPEGRPEEQFGAVRDVVPLADGGVAVLDGQAADIRLFDAGGAYRATLGSRGRGPGGLRRPIALAVLPGDTLAVFDAESNRVTRFGPDGGLGGVTTLRDIRGRIAAAAFLEDGRLIGQSRWLAPQGAPLPGPGLAFARDTAVLTLFATDGSVTDTVDVVPGSETITGVQVSGQGVSVFRRSAAFGRSNVFAAHPAGIWSSPNDRFELRLRDARGRLTRVVRAPGLEEPVTDAAARVIRDRALADAQTPEARRRAEDWYALSPRPATQPAFDAIAVDDRARLWVRAWSPSSPATRWWVFAADGDLLGSVHVPNGTRITAVRCGSVWGVEQDELDVSYAVRYALRGTDGC